MSKLFSLSLCLSVSLSLCLSFSLSLSLSLSLSYLRDVDKIDSLMQDITEQQEVAQEICDAIARPFGDTFDEVRQRVF